VYKVKIYIAGPYTADKTNQIEANVLRAIEAGLEVFKKGHFPYIPHLTHYVDIVAKNRNLNMCWADYIKWDFEWLVSCDGLLFLGVSPGANKELEEAKRLGLKIYYSSEEILSD